MRRNEGRGKKAWIRQKTSTEALASEERNVQTTGSGRKEGGR